MNRTFLSWGIALSVFALNLTGARGQTYDFAVVSNNAAAGNNLNGVANNGNIFVCVGGANSPTFAVNSNNFSSVMSGPVDGGFLLKTNAWVNSLNSTIKRAFLNCVAAGQGSFIASGASNAVLVSADGVNWTNLVHVSGNSTIVIGGIAYNPSSGTFADAEENNSASYATNPTNSWHASGLPGLSLAETFLAVGSSANSGDMALCGILGDIRISTNGGQTWFISQQENSSMPNLNSVAYDTGANLVSAGTTLIEVGTNGGYNKTNWTFQTKIIIGTSASPTNFNAVAYNSATSNFLAAGSLGGNGLIVMATNGAPAAQWTWARQTNIFALQNGVLVPDSTPLPALNGASFANTGFFQGIGMVVGNNGEILVAGVPPPAPGNTVGNDVTNLLSSPQINSAMGSAGNIVPDSNHPAGVLGIDWYSAPVGGTELATNTPVLSPPGSLYNTCGTFTVWAQERDLRTGFVNTNRAAFSFTILPIAPTNASVGVAEVLGSVYTPVSVNLLVNASNPPSAFAVNWYNTATGSNSLNFLGQGGPANIGNQFFFTPADTVCGTFTVFAETKAISTPPSGLPLMSTNRVAVTYSIVPAAPSNPVSVTNCAGNGTFGMCANPSLTVTVTSPLGQTNEVNWFDGNSNFLVTTTSGNNVFSYTPANAAAGIYTFYAQTTNLPTGFVSALTPLKFQVNPLPVWTSSAGYSTNADSTSPQTNPVVQPPSVANAATITSFEPGSTITFDWYTNGDPNVATYENPTPPYAYGSGGPGGTIVPTFGGFPFIPTNSVPGTYTYYVRARAVSPGFTACACQSTNLVAVTFNLLPPGPTAASGVTTNVLTGAIQNNAPIWVDVVTNNNNQVKNLSVDWFATSNSVNNIDNASDTNLANRFFHTPTNALCGVFTNWAQTKAGGFVPGKTRFPVSFVIIPNAPSAVGSLNQTNCTEVPNPAFTVAVTNGQTANWFAVPSSGTALTNTLNFIPTNSLPGTWTFSAQAVDTASGLSSTNSTTATLTLSNCTGPLTISNNPATGTATIQWPGDLVLLSSSNLVDWTIVSTGSVFAAPNTLSWTYTNPPVQFFRLTN